MIPTLKTTTEKAIVTTVLTQAFADNGSVNYVVGKKERSVKRLMKYSYEMCKHGGGVSVNEQQNSVMLHKFSEKSPTGLFSFWEEVKLAVLGIGPTRILKVLRRESYIAKHKMQEPHLYLWFIGTLPEAQGRGLGSQLLKDLLEEADNLALPVCLETSNPRNLPFYRKYGFHIYHQSETKKLGYKLWFLKKESKKGKKKNT